MYLFYVQPDEHPSDPQHSKHVAILQSGSHYAALQVKVV